MQFMGTVLSVYIQKRLGRMWKWWDTAPSVNSKWYINSEGNSLPLLTQHIKVKEKMWENLCPRR